MPFCRDCGLMFTRPSGSRGQKLCNLCWEIARNTRKRPILLKKLEKRVKNVSKRLK